MARSQALLQQARRQLLGNTAFAIRHMWGMRRRTRRALAGRGQVVRAQALPQLALLQQAHCQLGRHRQRRGDPAIGRRAGPLAGPPSGTPAPGGRCGRARARLSRHLAVPLQAPALRRDMSWGRCSTTGLLSRTQLSLSCTAKLTTLLISILFCRFCRRLRNSQIVSQCTDKFLHQRINRRYASMH